MTLVWTREARADRRTIYEYIEAESQTAAIRLDELFSRRAALLKHHPMIGRPGRVTDTRELVIQRNYVLIYDLADDEVRILRILHAARQWPPTADE